MVLLASPEDVAAQAVPVAEAPEGAPVFSLGPVDYRAGRGLHVDEIGLSVGGFTTVEIEKIEGEPAEVALDGPNFLILLHPFAPLRFFAELEMGDVFEWEVGGDPPESSPTLETERLYADLIASDALALRFGKFQTPVGRWNLVPAEPFVWTPTQPVQLEVGLGEESLTGATLFGTIYPGSHEDDLLGDSHELQYWLFGQFVDPFDLEADEDPPDRGVGGRIQYGKTLGTWSVGASLLASEDHGDWTTLGGLDAQLHLGERFELSSEAVFSRGEIPGRDYWGVFVEGAYRLDLLSSCLSDLYWITRLEHFDGESEPDTQVADLALTWIPRHWLIVKAGYRLTTQQIEDVERGFIGSASVVY